MTKMKYLGSFLLVLAVLFAQVGSAVAAPQTQDGTVTVSGTVTEIGQPETVNGVTTVPIKVEKDGVTQTVRVSEEVAAGLTVGEQVNLTVNSGDVIPPEETEEPDVHPIAKLLGSFFDVNAGDVNEFHQDGFGFGVIAQALWMSKDLKGEADATLAGEILQAKKDKTFEQFFADHQDLFPDGSTAPTNWGQMKKALKQHNSVGQAKPGHGNDNEDSSNVENNGKKNKDNGNKDNGNKDKGNQGKNDSNPGKGKGNGKP